MASGEDAISHVVDHDLQHAELVSLPITLIILLIAFGAFVAAVVPLLLGLTSVAGALGAFGTRVAPRSQRIGDAAGHRPRRPGRRN